MRCLLVWELLMRQTERSIDREEDWDSLAVAELRSNNNYRA